MSRHSYDAVLFDLDGTLVDSYDALQASINHVLMRHEVPPVSRQHLMSLVGEGVVRLLEKAFDGRPTPPTAVADFEEHYDAICTSQSYVLESVLETLDVLSARGIPMAVCTNKPTSFSTKILAALGIADRFVTIAGPDAAGARKPDARHLEFALHLIGVPAPAALMVGDMPIDVAAARNATMDVAVIATGSSSREELIAAHPDYLLTRFSDLIDIVQGQA